MKLNFVQSKYMMHSVRLKFVGKIKVSEDKFFNYTINLCTHPKLRDSDLNDCQASLL